MVLVVLGWYPFGSLMLTLVAHSFTQGSACHNGCGTLCSQAYHTYCATCTLIGCYRLFVSNELVVSQCVCLHWVLDSLRDQKRGNRAAAREAHLVHQRNHIPLIVDSLHKYRPLTTSATVIECVAHQQMPAENTQLC